MSTNNRNIENQGDFEQDKNLSGRPQGTNTGPVSGSAANTRGENKPSSKSDDSQQNKSPQGSNANLTTTSRGADSTDKEFRNNQPNASTLKGHKNSADLGNELE